MLYFNLTQYIAVRSLICNNLPEILMVSNQSYKALEKLLGCYHLRFHSTLCIHEAVNMLVIKEIYKRNRAFIPGEISCQNQTLIFLWQ